MSAQYEDLLGQLDLALDEARCPGLVATDGETLRRRLRAGADPSELVALERALHFGADHVYFRLAPDQPPTPVAWLYDRCGDRALSADVATPEARAELHRRVWSAGEVPLVFVFRPTLVDIYHVLQGPRYGGTSESDNPWETVEILRDAATLQALSPRRLEDGRLWEEHPRARALSFRGAAFMALAAELDRHRHTLVHKDGVPDGLVKRLLILFVLVQYLDERRAADGSGVFPPGTFERHAPGAANFVDLLRAGSAAVTSFLDELAHKNRLNGTVFTLSDLERRQISHAPLHRFAQLLEGMSDGPQRVLWRRYAFAELPVELISHLYEQFLPRQQGVVYTPPFLVQLMLDQVLPLSERTPPGFAVLDPACGSGVFLVGAFKRLVQRWRRDHEFARPSVEVLQTLLRDHIYGVDNQPDAVQLTLFSLSVALCDFLEPKVIWEELHFEDLVGRTVLKGDFFDHCQGWEGNGEGRFDLIVGNPPFASELSDAGRAALDRFQAADPELQLPDNQAALLFLEAALKVVRPRGRVALVQPAAPLLYNKGSLAFRSHFLSRHSVPVLVDLTALGRVLFRRAGRANRVEDDEEGSSQNPGDVPVVLLFAERRTPEDTPLLHVTVRRTPTSDLKLGIEIDHYDLHTVSQLEARTDPHVWKANSLGGSRVLHLIHRLSRMDTLKEFLDRKVRETSNKPDDERWYASEGYTRGDERRAHRMLELKELAASGALSERDEVEYRMLRGRYKQADWLTGKKVLVTEDLTTRGGPIEQLEATARIEEQYFAEPRKPILFKPPVLLIRETMEAETGRIPTFLSREEIRFNHQIFGIHCPAHELSLLTPLIEYLDTPLVRFHLLATSSRISVTRSSSFLQRDLLRLPYSPDPKLMALSDLEQVIVDDVVQWAPDARRMGPDAPVYQPPNGKELRAFGTWFCRVLGSVYPQISPGEPTPLRRAVCFPFWFGEDRDETHLNALADEASLEALLRAQVGPALAAQRVVRAFVGDLLILVKPRQRRYWLRSVAIRDADEAFAHLQAAGY